MQNGIRKWGFLWNVGAKACSLEFMKALRPDSSRTVCICYDRHQHAFSCGPRRAYFYANASSDEALPADGRPSIPPLPVRQRWRQVAMFSAQSGLKTISSHLLSGLLTVVRDGLEFRIEFCYSVARCLRLSGSCRNSESIKHVAALFHFFNRWWFFIGFKQIEKISILMAAVKMTFREVCVFFR